MLGFLGKLFHDFMIFQAVEKSRDAFGIPDRSKALGYAAGHITITDEDFLKIDAILEAENGASDNTDNPYTEALMETGLYPKATYEDTYVGNNLVFADDMELLHNAGYDAEDQDCMDSGEIQDAMEDSGVDTIFYDFDN